MLKNFSDEEKRSSLLLASLIALGCVLLGYHFVLTIEGQRQMLLIYGVTAGGLVLALLLYRLFLQFSRHDPLAAKVSSKPIAWTAVLLAFIGMAAVQGHRSIAEQNGSETVVQNSSCYIPGKLWFKIPWVWSALFCLAFFIFILSLYHKEKERSDYSLSLPVAVVYLLSAALFALATYAPNALNNDTHHMIAVLQSVYNAAFDIPFNIRSTGIYGHYAIFAWPFLKVFGHKPQTIAVMFSIVSFLSQLLLLYTLHHSVKSDIVRILGALASVVPITVYLSSTFLQDWPLRIFPPALILAYITYSHIHAGPKHQLRRIVTGYGLCAFAISFTTDVGLVSTIVYTAWLCRCALKENAVFSRAMGRMYLISLGGCAGAVLGDIAIINLYNLVICHGQPILRACFFPMIGAENTAGALSYVEMLQIPLPRGNYSWLWVMALFFIAVLVGTAGTTLLPLQGPADGDLLFAAAVMGLGVNFYYLNRAAYPNLYIIMPEAALCMAFLVDHALRSRGSINSVCSLGGCLHTGAALAAFLELSTLAAVTLVFGGSGIEDHVNRLHYSMDSLAALAQQVEECVPKNTYAYGQIVQEVYAYLDWDPGYHLRDASDMFADVSTVVEEINSQESLLICNNPVDLSFLYPDTPLVLQFGIPADNPILYYYVRQ